MKITHFFSNNSKNANDMRYDFEHYVVTRSIYSAYNNNPSQSKVSAYNAIQDDYKKGRHNVTVKGKQLELQYRYDLRVTAASSHFFSTIASFIDINTGKIYLVKETHCNTYMCEL